MSHGIEPIENEMFDNLKKDFENQQKTNQFPNGKLNDNDQGALSMLIGIEEMKGTKICVVEFPTPIHWFGMNRNELNSFIDKLQTIEKKLK